MEYGRYGRSHVLWAFYSLFICVCMALVSREFFGRLSPRFLNWYPAVAGAVLLFLFLAYRFGFRLCSGHAGRKGRMSIRAEGLFLAGLAVAAVLLRLRPVSMSDGWLSRGAGNAGAVWPEWSWVFAIPIFLYLLGIFLFYSALRLLSGRFTAGFVAVGLSVLPFPIKDSFPDGKAELYFFLFSLLALLAALTCRREWNRAGKSWPLALFTGAACGAAARADLLFLSPLLLCFSVLFLQEGPKDAGKGAKTAGILLGAALGGFLCVLLGQSCLSGTEPKLPVLRRRPDGAFLERLAQLDTVSLVGITVLLCLAALYIFGFFRQERNAGNPWLLPFLFLNALFFFAETDAGGRILFSSWLLLAGMGIHSMLCTEEAGERRAAKAPAVPPSSTDQERKKPPLRPGEPIPNPLPGPKKHVRRELDYAFVPEERQMCYDIPEIDENDDFEI